MIHGDLKAVSGLRFAYFRHCKRLIVEQTNVLVDASGNPRITDFGLVRIIDSQATNLSASSFAGKGSLRWQAPELLDTSRFPEGHVAGITTKTDIYAFGCVCLEVCSCYS